MQRPQGRESAVNVQRHSRIHSQTPLHGTVDMAVLGQPGLVLSASEARPQPASEARPQPASEVEELDAPARSAAVSAERETPAPPAVQPDASAVSME
eukprot:6173180-Pleurochrysis_carterae.AAC.3